MMMGDLINLFFPSSRTSTTYIVQQSNWIGIRDCEHAVITKNN